jgi:hypothetical protein
MGIGNIFKIDDRYKHIFGLVYYLFTVSISGVTHMENDLLFCSILKLMFTNGKIIVYKFMIHFYSYLYFCQSYSKDLNKIK